MYVPAILVSSSALALGAGHPALALAGCTVAVLSYSRSQRLGWGYRARIGWKRWKELRPNIDARVRDKPEQAKHRPCGAETFGGSIDRLLEAFNRLTKRRRWKRAVTHWFRALEISPGRNGTYHPHFHVLLVVPAEYFDPNSPLYILQDEWRRMWQEALRTTERRIVDVRVKEDPGEVAKYVTKPGAYLRLEGDDSWWCDPDRLATLHYALGNRRC